MEAFGLRHQIFPPAIQELIHTSSLVEDPSGNRFLLSTILQSGTGRKLARNLTTSALRLTQIFAGQQFLFSRAFFKSSPNFLLLIAPVTTINPTMINRKSFCQNKLFFNEM
jgi:hypothetical protein